MDTLGWDTVHVIRKERVNEALAAEPGRLRLDFDARFPDDPSVRAHGTFDPWRIAEGGSEERLHLTLPIRSGTLGYDGGDGRHEVDLAGATVILSVSLAIVPVSGETGKESLVFDLERVGAAAVDPPGPGTVGVIDVLDPSGRLSRTDKAVLGELVAQDLVANADRISFVFATIDLVPPASDPWLAPTASRYSFLHVPFTGSGYLAVMSVCDGRPVTGLLPTVDPAAITSGRDRSFVISQNRFLDHVIRPYLAGAYGTAPDMFYLDAGSHTIRNRAHFPTRPITSGAITYYPQISTLALTTTGEGLETRVEGFCDLYAGISMSFWVSTRNRAEYDPAERAIRFLPDPNPSSGHSADIPWYYWLLGPLPRLITELVVRLVSDDVAASLDRLAREALSITRNPPQLIRWAGTGRFEPTVAGIDRAFYMME